jgi:hypothetical protein
MPNPWLNVHKSTAAMNYFFSNMTNTVIVMTLGDLIIRPQIFDWKKKHNLKMNKRLQGRFREVIYNNYTLYYFVYMYTQMCDENALIWSFPRRMFRPLPM